MVVFAKVRQRHNQRAEERKKELQAIVRQLKAAKQKPPVVGQEQAQTTPDAAGPSRSETPVPRVAKPQSARTPPNYYV